MVRNGTTTDLVPMKILIPRDISSAQRNRDVSWATPWPANVTCEMFGLSDSGLVWPAVPTAFGLTAPALDTLIIRGILLGAWDFPKTVPPIFPSPDIKEA